MSEPPKLKVLFVLRSLEMGGVQRMVLDYLENLPRDRFDLTLMVSLFQGELRTEIPPHVKLIKLANGKEDYRLNASYRDLRMVARRIKLKVYKLFPRLKYALKVKERYDIEIASSYAEFDLVLNSPNRNSVKVAWFHTDVSYDNNRERARQRVETMKKFDWLVFVSEQTRRVIEEQFGVTYPNSTVIYNPFRCSDIRSRAAEEKVIFENRPVFSSMGRLHTRKGYDLLLEAHRRLLNEGFPHEIVIVGDGPEKDNLLNLIEKLDIGDTFKMLGNRNNPLPWIAASDFFVVPSRSEAYPLVIGEALALGKPVLATAVGGVPEMIIHEKNGYLIGCSEEELYTAMKRFLTEPKLIETLKNGASQADETFDAAKIYRKVTDLLNTLYGKKCQHLR